MARNEEPARLDSERWLQATVRVCVLSDLHLQPPRSRYAERLAHVGAAVSPACDLVVYSGDVMTMDGCEARAVHNSSACDEWTALAREAVDTIAKPFLFTLGNHDGEPGLGPRQRLAESLAGSDRHVGACDANLTACMHPWLDIATLDSGTLGCHAHTHYGCPSPAAASFIDAALAARAARRLALLFTHIPPPNVLGLGVHGQAGESVCCWDTWDGAAAVLPRAPALIHAFGHDHSNLFVSDASPSTGTRYVAVFKSGTAPESYDAAFYRGASGFTTLLVGAANATLGSSRTFEGEELAHLYANRSDRTAHQVRCGLDAVLVRSVPAASSSAASSPAAVGGLLAAAALLLAVRYRRRATPSYAFERRKGTTTDEAATLAMESDYLGHESRSGSPQADCAGVPRGGR